MDTRAHLDASLNLDTGPMFNCLPNLWLPDHLHPGPHLDARPNVDAGPYLDTDP